MVVVVKAVIGSNRRVDENKGGGINISEERPNRICYGQWVVMVVYKERKGSAAATVVLVCMT